ncbi:uncharacterized protein JCM6883_000407 [Sporobolomyces salmoneus]|uniref:uncharacterized protein n=1 Tax=Sporobolomyces salmoneus TaxID=183962 RepID=UPI003177217A
MTAPEEGYKLEDQTGNNTSSVPPSPRRRVRLLSPLPTAGNSNSTPTTYSDPLGSTGSNSPEPLATPTLSESAGKLRKNLSFKSLKELELKELSHVVYRKGSRQDMKVYRPKNDEEVFAHALRGGLRSLLLGSTLRALVNLVIVLLRLTRKRGLPAKLVLNALFGPDVIRFGSMLGLFSFLYKWTLHTLRLYNFGPLGAGHTETWHPAIAGAISGLSVLAEKKTRRITLGQQLLVRGLQGRYNILKSRGKIPIKNVSILVFGFSCANIMYSWLMAPEALPSGYRNWITNASKVSLPCLPVNLTASRQGTFDPAMARQALEWGRGATGQNAALIEAYAQNAEKGDFGPPFAPCYVVHPFVDSCKSVAIDRWQVVFRWIAPVYAGLHLIPPIILRYKAFAKNPQSVFTRAFFGTLRSSSFLATFVVIFQSLVCLQRNIYNTYSGKIPDWLMNVVLHKSYYWFSGFATCLSLFIEEKKRRRELAMYVLPRGLESVWSILRSKSYVPFVPGGEVLLTSAGLSMVMSTYQSNPQALSGLVRSVLYQFVGHG